MDLPKMILELQAEKRRLDEAILALERLAATKKSRRAKLARTNSPEEEQEEKAPSAETAS